MDFPMVDKTSWFYKNCKRQRKNNAKICQVCPFRSGIEKQEENEQKDNVTDWNLVAKLIGDTFPDGITEQGIYLPPVGSHESNPFTE